MNQSPYTLPEIQDGLDRSYAAIETLVEQLEETVFHHRPQADKWSVGENLDHLILASMGIASALARPKAFFARFGAPQRSSRTYDELWEEYFPSITGREAPENVAPDMSSPKSKMELIGSWKMIRTKLAARLPEHWEDAELDQHCVFHPAFGQITMREMLLFIIFHNEHHRKAMEAAILSAQS